MSAIFDQVPSHWNLCKSALSLHLLTAENAVEECLHIKQTPKERNESYSFLKGIPSIFVKIPFCALSAVVSLIEGIARIILAGIAYIGACCLESWNEVPGNLWNSAIAIDRSNGSLSCLAVFVMSVSLPFSDAAEMVPKIGERAYSLLGN